MKCFHSSKYHLLSVAVRNMRQNLLDGDSSSLRRHFKYFIHSIRNRQKSTSRTFRVRLERKYYGFGVDCRMMIAWKRGGSLNSV